MKHSQVYDSSASSCTGILTQHALRGHGWQFGNRPGRIAAGAASNSKKGKQQACKNVDQSNDRQPRPEWLLPGFVTQCLLGGQRAKAAAGQSQDQQCLFRDALPAKPRPALVAPELSERNEIDGCQIDDDDGFSVRNDAPAEKSDFEF